MQSVWKSDWRSKHGLKTKYRRVGYQWQQNTFISQSLFQYYLLKLYLWLWSCRYLLNCSTLIEKVNDFPSENKYSHKWKQRILILYLLNFPHFRRKIYKSKENAFLKCSKEVIITVQCITHYFLFEEGLFSTMKIIDLLKVNVVSQFWNLLQICSKSQK